MKVLKECPGGVDSDLFVYGETFWKKIEDFLLKKIFLGISAEKCFNEFGRLNSIRQENHFGTFLKKKYIFLGL